MRVRASRACAQPGYATRMCAIALSVAAAALFATACSTDTSGATASSAESSAAAPAADAGSGKQAPMFEVDPYWPKPLPNHWVTGSTIGLSVDAQDNVYTIHRQGAVEDNFKAADIKESAAKDDEASPTSGGNQGVDDLIG